MTIEIMNPVALGGAAAAVGTTVGASTKRKYTKMTAYNGTGAVATLKVYLVPAVGTASALTGYIDYDMAIRETYNCPECIGAALAAGGQLWGSGAGVSLSAVANDTINS